MNEVLCDEGLESKAREKVAVVGSFSAAIHFFLQLLEPVEDDVDLSGQGFIWCSDHDETAIHREVVTPHVVTVHVSPLEQHRRSSGRARSRVE